MNLSCMSPLNMNKQLESSEELPKYVQRGQQLHNLVNLASIYI